MSISTVPILKLLLPLAIAAPLFTFIVTENINRNHNKYKYLVKHNIAIDSK